MDKASLLDLFRYTDYAWDQIRQAVPGDEDLVRPAPGSGWPTLRNCIAHMVLAYERWLPAIVELAPRPLPDLAPGAFKSWTEIDEYRAGLRRRLRQLLDTWSEDELALRRDVDVDGEVIRYSPGELVIHLLLHERGHHGDVTTLFCWASRRKRRSSTGFILAGACSLGSHTVLAARNSARRGCSDWASPRPTADTRQPTAKLPYPQRPLPNVGRSQRQTQAGSQDGC